MGVSMKYNGLDSILDRDLAIVCSKKTIEKYTPYLQELINYAVELFGRCSISAKRFGGTPLSPLSIFRNSIQMADGIEVLLSQATHTPCIPLMRALFEAELSLAYMFKEKYEERSGAWLVWGRLQQIKYLNSVDPSSNNQSTFKKAMDSSVHADFVRSEVDLEGIQREIEQWRKSVSNPKFKEIVEHYQSNKNIRYWYQICDGPSNLCVLAEKVGRLDQYIIFYKLWCLTTHMQSKEDLVKRTETGGQIVPIRSTPEEVKSMYIDAGSRIIRISELMGQMFRPTEPILDRQREIMRRHRPEAFDK